MLDFDPPVGYNTISRRVFYEQTHHDMCGACEKVSLEYTLKSSHNQERSQRILSQNPDWAKLHFMISTAISRRDKLWREYNDTKR